MNTVLKCRKCRFVLINQKETFILDKHYNVLTELNNSIMYDCGGEVLNVWYLDETGVPVWIIDNLDEAKWIKGKLICPQCSAKIGSFDFISGFRCTCSSYVLPPVHIVKSKVDLIIS